MKKIIQIACMNETDRGYASLYALTEEGKIYFLVLNTGEWYEQALPTGKIQIQETA